VSLTHGCVLGRVSEQGAPSELLSRPGGQLAGMVAALGGVDALLASRGSVDDETH